MRMIDINLTRDDILNNIKEELGGDWKDLSDAKREGVEKTAMFMAKILARDEAGEDVGRQLIHVKAQLANWKFVGSSMAQRAFWSTVVMIAEKTGLVLIGFAKKALLGIS